ncbi:hypothetical protein GCM10010172_16390 [Paractinoplanes ferrugineus]|uniref:Uncharacterized protein n=1 Tax=Paractinoplanes ferrugineus TaxID=113564 RepID=A0A919MBY6_9ACTN|nr:hypothetical protein [Actinoplanes ferrugineus]GIE10203.1 hypothetical protein Afe05nite_20430 [Actinoplanes ferrugineus]
MSSALLKAAFAGAVTAGALFLPATAAQAATNHHPCDGPGFSDAAFFDDDFGIDDDFDFDDDFGVDDDFDFDDELDLPWRHRHDHTTVVVVTVQPKPGHKPGGGADADDVDFTKPAHHGGADNDGYGGRSVLVG